MLLFALVAHEFAHGWAAYMQGDDTAFKLGRLTLNPIPHIDPVMTIALPIFLLWATAGQFVFGGARPVPITPRLFRNYRRGDLIVSSAGVATNFVLAILCTLAIIALGSLHSVAGGAGTAGIQTAQRMMTWGIQLNLILAVFNLIPVPPLDGSRIFYHFLPPALGAQYRQLDRYGILILMALLWFARPLMSILLAPAFILMQFLTGIAAPFAVGNGMRIFQ
jgi:Zn-dependent protease